MFFCYVGVVGFDQIVDLFCIEVVEQGVGVFFQFQIYFFGVQWNQVYEVDGFVIFQFQCGEVFWGGYWWQYDGIVEIYVWCIGFVGMVVGNGVVEVQLGVVFVWQLCYVFQQVYWLVVVFIFEGVLGYWLVGWQGYYQFYVVWYVCIYFGGYGYWQVIYVGSDQVQVWVVVIGWYYVYVDVYQVGDDFMEDIGYWVQMVFDVGIDCFDVLFFVDGEYEVFFMVVYQYLGVVWVDVFVVVVYVLFFG